MAFNLTISGVGVQVDNINVVKSGVTDACEHLRVGNDEVWSSSPTPTPSEFDFTLTNDTLTQTLNYVQSSADAVSIDWGDGSSQESSSTAGATTMSHTYSSAGNYTVKFFYANGETVGLGHGGTSNTFVGQYNTALTTARLSSGAFVNTAGLFRVTALRKIVFSADTINIPNNAMRQATALAELVCYAVNPPTLGTNPFETIAVGFGIYVPAESVAAYQSASGWSAFAAYIQAIPS